MIEKTFKVSKNGTIDQDFKNRSISQYLHNAVQVNVDIPNECFENLGNYGVEMACVLCDMTGTEIKQLYSLVMIENEVEIEGYKRWSCVLSLGYTKELGKLKLTPYIRTTSEVEIDGEMQTVVSIQQTFTNTYLNIVFAVPNTTTIEIEDAPVITQLENQINIIYNRLHQIEQGGTEDYHNVLAVYPVGSIYITTTQVDPSTLFGGGWEQIAGKFLLSSDDMVGADGEILSEGAYHNGDTGGEAAHILTINEMPSHNHSGTTGNEVYPERAVYDETDYGVNYGIASLVQDDFKNIHQGIGQEGTNRPFAVASVDGLHHTHSIQSNGSGNAHNNMPPYIVVYVWQRVS